MAAAIATITTMRTTSAFADMTAAGERFRAGITAQIGELAHGTASYSGPVTMPYVTFGGDDDHAIVSAFSRVCLREGLFLHPRHNWFLSAAHDDDVIDRALSATAVAFSEIDPLLDQSSAPHNDRREKPPMTDTNNRPSEEALEPAVDNDSVVSAFGYTQELNRALKFFSLFAVAFSVVSISTGVFLNYGFAINSFGPAAIWTWPIAAVGQIVMALIMAELATKIPLAGYAYQWGARLVSSAYGWFVAAFALIYMLVTVGAISLLGIGPLLLTSLGISDPDQRLVLAVAAFLMVTAIAINVISVKLASRVNNLAVFAEIAGTMFLAVLLLIVWASTPMTRSVRRPPSSPTPRAPQGGSAFYCFALAGLHRHLHARRFRAVRRPQRGGDRLAEGGPARCHRRVAVSGGPRHDRAGELHAGHSEPRRGAGV